MLQWCGSCWPLVFNNRLGPSPSGNDSKFTGRAGLIYNFDNGLAPYASYSTSYNPIVGLNTAGGLLLPETAEQTEVGVKYQPVGLNTRFGAALFDLKRKNALTTAPNNVLFQTQNGEVTSRGLERPCQYYPRLQGGRELHQLRVIRQ